MQVERRHQVQDWRDCANMCYQTDNCTLWSWASPTFTTDPEQNRLKCWLKSGNKTSSLSSVINYSHSHMVSGVKCKMNTTILTNTTTPTTTPTTATATSKATTTANAPLCDDVMEDNTKYSEMDTKIERIFNVTDWRDCADHCYRMEQCKTWNWCKPTFQVFPEKQLSCWLFSGIKTKKSDVGYVSGIKCKKN